jgi:uncharacterized DUF497 family protein
MLFEWDDDKDRINIKSHFMPLRAGIPVFDDINAIEFEDSRVDYGEERYIIIGRDDRTKLLYVVYTIRGQGSTRLISVRKATKHEQRFYQNSGY